MSVMGTLSELHRRAEDRMFGHADARRPTVIVADDDPLVQRLIGAVLGPRYRVIPVSDGLSAINFAREERPDLIILDYVLPGLHGYEACRQIKKDPASAGQKVLLLTAYREAGGAARAREVGADEFLLKPFSPQSLLGIVERLLSTPDPLST